MTPLEAARLLASIYGKPVDHPWKDCDHPTTQQGGDGCHRFKSCHAAWPHRCQYMPHEHHREGAPELAFPQIIDALEAAQEFVGTRYYIAGDRIPEQFTMSEPINRVVRALKGEPEPPPATH